MTASSTASTTGTSNDRIRLVLAALAGASVVASFAPFVYAWLAPFSLAILLLLLESADRRAALQVSVVFALGMFSAGTYWTYISLNGFGGLWPPFAVLLSAVLICATSAFVAAGAYASFYLAPAAGPLRWFVVFPAAWVIAEWARGWMFTGFPWMSLGYGQVETPLAALAPLVGVHGITWVIALIAACTVTIILRAWPYRLAAIALVAAVLVAMQSLGKQSWTEAAGEELSVTLVQGAIPQEIKWAASQLQPTLDLYRRLTLEQGPSDLVVWPEAAIPAIPEEVPAFIDSLRAELTASGTQLFTGILSYDFENRQFLNTLWGIGAHEGRYYKRHLVMFGEYFPLPDFMKRWLRIMNLPNESLAAGSDDQPLLQVQGVPVAASICYEMAFSGEQLAFLPEAQLLVNVSNDAWFGDSIAPHQHLQIGQMRARESERYLLRATNTGVTAIIGPDGRIIDRIPQFQPGALTGIVQPRSGATPYVRYGNTPIVLGASCILLVALIRRRLRRRRPM